MNPILIAAIYALVADVVATFFAALFAITARGRVSRAAVGALLSGSGGFILGVAFLFIIPESQHRVQNNLVLGVGIGLGLLLMIGLGKKLGVFGTEEQNENAKNESPSSVDRIRKAKMFSVGIGIHNVPEALPIGAALVVSPVLSALVAALMTIETFAESNTISGELIQTKVSRKKIFAYTMWPSVLSMIGAPIGVMLARISPLFFALTFGFTAGIMLFISGEVWSDGRKDAGIVWSSVGLLGGVLLALFVSAIGF